MSVFGDVVPADADYAEPAAVCGHDVMFQRAAVDLSQGIKGGKVIFFYFGRDKRKERHLAAVELRALVPCHFQETIIRFPPRRSQMPQIRWETRQ